MTAWVRPADLLKGVHLFEYGPVVCYSDTENGHGLGCDSVAGACIIRSKVDFALPKAPP